MKKLLVLSLTAAGLLYAGNYDRNFDGYSYFAFGVENLKYNEKFVYTFNTSTIGENGKSYSSGQQVAVKSKINVTSPVYLSGGLIRFTDKWDLSMDFASTLKPNSTTEDWMDRSDDSTITSNYAEVMTNAMKFLLHYKLTKQHRVTFGFSYILNTFKRYADPKVTNTTALVQETSATATLDVGYWFESATAAKDGFRIKYEITAGLPVYQDVQNTKAPNLTFDETKGFNFDTSLYMGYTLFRGLELGFFANYAYMYRDGDTKKYNGQTVIWPTNITQNIRGGLQVSWKFD